MTAVTGGNCSGRARHATRRYKVMEVFVDGGSALVEWRFETGRTHQIRVHAKYLGIPLHGDEVYGGTKDMALSLIQPRTARIYHSKLIDLVSGIQRPCLHAMVLGFKHPYTVENMHFSCPPPADFSEVRSLYCRLSASRQTRRELPKRTKPEIGYCNGVVVSLTRLSSLYHGALKVEPFWQIRVRTKG